MFIQSAAPGSTNRAITMYDHAFLSGQFARAFGNAAFATPEPLDLVVYVIANHDAGWVDFDRDPATDETTGLPYTVFQTPARHILPTSKASPDYNERHHAYCGLLSSMHTWGIYNGRYGFTTAGRLARIADADKPAIKAMLAGELARQQRLRTELAASPQTACWIEEQRLFQSYKLLQFCDLLAIYFNTTHAQARTEHSFINVPSTSAGDVTVTITPKGEGRYALRPFPFQTENSQFAFAYREIAPNTSVNAVTWRSALLTSPVKWETITLVSE